MRAVLACALLLLLVSGCAAWPGPWAGPALETAIPLEDSPVGEFEEFALFKSEDTWALANFSDRVYIGLADDVLVRKPAEALRHPAAWKLVARDEAWRGTGRVPYSALEVLGEARAELVAVHGPHLRCDEPPIEPPAEFRGYEQWSIQPANPGSCALWFAVDVWLNPSGEIAAVTLDFREP